MKLSTLTDFLDRLDKADVHYILSSIREGAILVSVAVDDERWEFEFQEDGDIEVEVFLRDGEVGDEKLIDELLKRVED